MLILELLFANIELLIVTYNCLRKTLDSKIVLKNLDDLLKKTKISIIRDNTKEKTPNTLQTTS